MIVRPPLSLADMPSVGMLTGTTGAAQMLEAINASYGPTSYFDSVHNPYRDIAERWHREVLAPLQATANQLTVVGAALFSPDRIVPLLRLEDFAHVPASMHLAILTHAPVRRLLEQGRIDGFGYAPEHLPDEDVHGRLINNGRVSDILAHVDPATGYAPLVWHWKCDDPELSIEEIDYIEQTRRTVDRLLAETDYDPTCYPNSRE